MSTFPTPVTESCRSYYGVPVVDVGEDGDILVLGHEHHWRRALSAVNAHARYLGYEIGDELSFARRNLRERWAQLTTECCNAPLDDPEHPEVACHRCDRDRPASMREFAWCADWLVAEAAAGAFPVLVWQA